MPRQSGSRRGWCCRNGGSEVGALGAGKRGARRVARLCAVTGQDPTFFRPAKPLAQAVEPDTVGLVFEDGVLIQEGALVDQKLPAGWQPLPIHE